LLRADYIYTIGSEYQAEQLIFLDESAKDERTLTRHYGYSHKNQIVSQKVVFLRGIRYTILPALTLDGFIACDIMKGSCSKERFCSFILSQVVSIFFFKFLCLCNITSRSIFYICEPFLFGIFIKFNLIFIVTFNEPLS
jgi:hypothetical protein